MIKANELRIGNLIKHDNQVFTIDTIANEFPTLNTIKFGIGVVDWNNIEPIQLTPEWLIKFGFEKIDYHRFKIKPSQFDWYYTYSNHDNAFRFYVEDTIVCLNVIFYVHQLQNLYFALTGQELEFNQH